MHHHLLSALTLLVWLGATHPARAQDKELVPGDPPLTRGSFAKHVVKIEYFLGFRLTAAERAEYGPLLAADWKTRDRTYKLAFIRHDQDWSAAISKYGPVERTLERNRARPGYLAELRKSAAPHDQWLAARYAAARKAGGGENPVLAAGRPPLTQHMLTEFFEYLEWRHGLWRVGLTERSRDALRLLVVADWTSADPAGRDAVLADLKWWRMDFPKLSDAERRDPIVPTRRRSWYNTNGQRAASQDIEREVQLMTVDFTWRQKAHNTNMGIIDKIAGPVHEWRTEYNGATGRYESRYVPKP
jgi:hypothetical protein